MKLTPKQIRFVDEYLVDFNASRAAIAAGYSSSGAKVQGSRLLTNRSEERGVGKAWRIPSAQYRHTNNSQRD